MKYKLLIIPSILIIPVLFCCSDYGYRQNVMDTDLIQFFGGLDLGMKTRNIVKIDKGLKGSMDSFSIYYYGESRNNPILNLDISTDSGNLLGPFFNRCWIDNIHAEFSISYLHSKDKKPFEKWLSYFEAILRQSPVHFYNPTQPYYKDIYLWHFKNYNFEIWKTEADTINICKEVYFNAYLAGEQYPHYDDITKLFIISDQGDTTQYSFLDPEIKNIFGGYDIGMSIKNVHEKTTNYRVDKKNDIYFVNSDDGDNIELYFFDNIFGKDPFMIEGNIYKIRKYADNNLNSSNPDFGGRLINELTQKLNFPPIIYRCDNGYQNMIIYLWHYNTYNFEVRINYSNNYEILEIRYSAYKDSDSIPNGELDKNLSIFDLDWNFRDE